MTPLLEVRRLVKTFSRGRGPWRRGTEIRAVDDVSFTVGEGETFGLVGESGSGKTTTGRCVLRLIEPTSGEVRYRGTDVLALNAPDLRRLRQKMQIVFQDPYSSLNPRMRVRDIIEEPLIIHAVANRAGRAERVRELAEMVGLEGSQLDRYPHEFSGGQRQRIGLARARALAPSLIVADEPVSALDVSIQAQIINLFLDLQQRLALTLVFIAHDLRLVRHVCARVAVMYRGRIVEMGPTDAIFRGPAHPYTRSLLSAVPVTEPGARRTRLALDLSGAEHGAALREIAPGHFAALP
jgi:peptide/nickel transport system ATP-binding protein